MRQIYLYSALVQNWIQLSPPHPKTARAKKTAIYLIPNLIANSNRQAVQTTVPSD